MTVEEFSQLLPKIRPWTDYLYFHLMGEPLLHPKLAEFLRLAGDAGFRVILTTNGTLLARQTQTILNSAGLHKVNISLQAFEANDLSIPFQQYLEQCFRFGKEAEGRKLVVYRLWNHGGKETLNQEILETMERFFPKPWIAEPRGTRIGNRVYLEFGDKFDWPDLSAEEHTDGCFCYGLRDQLGILCDGSVVPCCLDHEGELTLGNLFDEDLQSILDSPKAKAIYNGFSERIAVEALCRRCGYIQRFKK